MERLSPVLRRACGNVSCRQPPVNDRAGLSGLAAIYHPAGANCPTSGKIRPVSGNKNRVAHHHRSEFRVRRRLSTAALLVGSPTARTPIPPFWDSVSIIDITYYSTLSCRSETALDYRTLSRVVSRARNASNLFGRAIARGVGHFGVGRKAPDLPEEERCA
jgi:hypothetical protein